MTKSILAYMFLIFLGGISVGYVLFADNNRSNSIAEKAAIKTDIKKENAEEISLTEEIKEIKPNDRINYNTKPDKQEEYIKNLISESNFRGVSIQELNSIILDSENIESWSQEIKNKIQLYRITSINVWTINNLKENNKIEPALKILAENFSCNTVNKMYTSKQKRYLSSLITKNARLIPTELQDCDKLNLFNGRGAIYNDAVSKVLK